ncbi:MAG: hypothetical protein KJ578_12775 [Bacteroidetes bacterium]|nr:hypothetical protein [Bacteroidota bacterium]MBU1578910.1 hypothetical protein [Bacteroidota bacterium]MBU2558644.1 hypothetical protein [Bacteroidota bacterium]
MKKIIITALFLLSISFGASQLSAQAPPPPPDGHGGTGNAPAEGGGAPIGGGLGILLALGAAYGGRKVYRAWKDQQEE